MRKAEIGLQHRRDMWGGKRKKRRREAVNINSEVDQKANIRRMMQFRSKQMVSENIGSDIRTNKS